MRRQGFSPGPYCSAFVFHGFSLRSRGTFSSIDGGAPRVAGASLIANPMPVELRSAVAVSTLIRLLAAVPAGRGRPMGTITASNEGGPSHGFGRNCRVSKDYENLADTLAPSTPPPLASPRLPQWVIPGCAGPPAAWQVNLNKRTPELERAHLAIRHPPAGRQRVRPAQLTLSDPLHLQQPTADRVVSAE